MRNLTERELDAVYGAKFNVTGSNTNVHQGYAQAKNWLSQGNTAIAGNGGNGGAGGAGGSASGAFGGAGGAGGNGGAATSSGNNTATQTATATTTIS